jgi:hypothetical protein
MAGDATTVQAAGRPQPQTTGEPQGGPFIRHAAPGRRPIYQATASFGLYFGPKMVAAPGWYRGYRLIFAASGGASGATPNADLPGAIVTQLQCKDAYGTNLFAGPGWVMLQAFQLLSGQFGLDSLRDVRNLPGSVALTAASNTFTLDTYLPFEFTQAYGVIAAANAALLPDLQMPIASLASVYGTPPTGSTLTITNDADFYWLPNVPTDPPGQGTTLQCIYQPCNPPIPSGGSMRVQLPRLGGYLAWLAFEMRDSTGVRVEKFPARPGIFVDSVELINSTDSELLDDMAISTGAGAVLGSVQATKGTTNMIDAGPATGVLAGLRWISRKTSLNQQDLGLLDTGEKFLSTNPGTQVEYNGVPWGSGGNAPYNLSAIIGQIVPSGRLIQGLPEV